MTAESHETRTSIILVTDLVGSTALRARLGEDAAEELRRTHDRLLTQTVQNATGEVVKGLGDGLLARFAGAADAVTAAVAIQQALDAHTRARPELALAARIGISAGDVVVEDGDCFGTPVIEASRLCAQARGGQILVAELVRLLARGRGGHGFRVVGDMDLKGLAEPVSAVEVLWEPVAAVGVPLPVSLASGERFEFVGRVAEVALLRERWKATLTSRRQVVLISGEPGMGKTRLAAEVARAAHSEGAVVLFGRADETADAPYRSVAEALGHLVEHASGEALAAHVADRGGVLVRLVPELARRITDLPPPGPGADDRLVVFDAAVDLLARAAAITPVMLVLDDLHWADHPSLLFLRHLARVATPMALLVVGTYRDTDLARTHPLAAVLADLRGERDVERVHLEGLDQDGVAELMVRAGGSDLDEQGLALARAVYEETDGNPFFASEVLVHLAESGVIYQQDGRWTSKRGSVADFGVPEGVREVIGRRLSGLSAPANEALRAASVAGVEFDAAVIAEVLGESVDAVVEVLDEPLARGLLAEMTDAVDRYRFQHALVRQTLYEELSMSRRVRLHQRVGLAFEATGRGTVAERAHQFVASAAVGEAERAVGYALQAAQEAFERLAYEQAMAWWRQALEAEELLPERDATRRVRLVLDLAKAADRAGETLAVRAELLTAADLARRPGQAELLAEIACAYGGEYSMWLDLADTTGLALVAEAEALLPGGDSQLRAGLLLRHSDWLAMQPDASERLRISADALAMARRAGDADLLGRTLVARAEALRGEPGVDEMAAVADEMAAVAEQAGETSVAATRAWYFRALAALRQGDVLRTAQAVQDGAGIAERTRSRSLMWIPRACAASLAILRGRYTDAQRHIDVAAELDYVVGETGDAVTRLQRFQVLFQTGRLDECRTLIEEGVALGSPFFTLIPGWGVVAAETGYDDAATREVRAWARDGLPFLPATWRHSTLNYASFAAAQFDETAAASIYALLAPFDGQWIMTGPELTWGPAALALARYAVAAGRTDTARHHFEDALAAAEAAGAPFYHARAAVELAELLMRSGTPDDAESVRALAAEAGHIADQHGMVDLARRAHAV